MQPMVFLPPFPGVLRVLWNMRRQLLSDVVYSVRLTNLANSWKMASLVLPGIGFASPVAPGALLGGR